MQIRSAQSLANMVKADMPACQVRATLAYLTKTSCFSAIPMTHLDVISCFYLPARILYAPCWHGHARHALCLADP